jgi:NADH-quinone oxidoreductase subunit C
MSTKYDKRIFLRILVPKTFIVPSISCLYRSANWLEREIWDLCGIFFYSHMDLRRILTDYGFEGILYVKTFL